MSSSKKRISAPSVTAPLSLAIAALAGLPGLGCGGDDFCDHYDASVAWSAVDPSSYEAAAATGSITIGGAHPRTIRDDSTKSRMKLDRGSIRKVALEFHMNAVILLSAPEEEGTFTLESHEATLFWCSVEGATLDSFNGTVAGCFGPGAKESSTLESTALHGSLVVNAKPDVERDDVRDYAYSFRIDGTGEKDDSTVNLDVVAFASWGVSYGKMCGSDQ